MTEGGGKGGASDRLGRGSVGLGRPWSGRWTTSGMLTTRYTVSGSVSENGTGERHARERKY